MRSDFKQFRGVAGSYFGASGDARGPVRKSLCSGSPLEATFKKLVAADTLAVLRIFDLQPSGPVPQGYMGGSNASPRYPLGRADKPTQRGPRLPREGGPDTARKWTPEKCCCTAIACARSAAGCEYPVRPATADRRHRIWGSCGAQLSPRPAALSCGRCRQGKGAA